MKNIFSNITWRTMKQNRSRTIVTIIGVILSTAMISAVTAFGSSIQDFLIEETIRQRGNWHMVMRVPTKEEGIITGDERVEAFGTTVSLGYAEAQGVEETDFAPYFHVESYSKECLDMVNLGITEGRMPENEGEILVPEFLLAMQKEDEKLSLGDELTLAIGKRMLGEEELLDINPYMSLKNPEMTEELLPDGEETLQIEETKTFTVVGVYSNNEIGAYISELSYQLISGPGQGNEDFCTVVVRLKSPRDVNEFEEEMTEKVSASSYSRNSTLLRWYGVDKNQNILKVFVRILGMIICLIVAASVSLIYNAFSISMRERTGQFGLLSSVGATKKQLRKSLRFEAWTVCLLGIPLGLLSGVAGIGITLYFVGPMMSDWIFGVDSGIALRVSVASMVIAAVIALVTVHISAWIPARRMKKLSPLEAIRASQDIQKLPKKVKRTGIAGRLFGLEGMLASKNYQRDKRKYRTTVVSLTLSIVLFVTSGAVVMYVQQAGDDVLNASVVDISVEGKKEGNIPEIMEELKAAEGSEEIYRYQSGMFAIRVEGELVPEEMKYQFTDGGDGNFLKYCVLYILPDDQFAEYAKEVGADPDAYLNQDELKAIYKDSFRQYNQSTGKYGMASLMENEEGTVFEMGEAELAEDAENFGVMKNSFRVTADKSTDIYPKASTQNYYSAMPAFVIAESTFEKAGTMIDQENMNTNFSLISKEYKKVYQDILKRSKDQNSPLYGCGIYNMNEGEEKGQNIMTVIRVLTTGFVVLMSLIAVANIFNTISTNLYLRRREFAMLRSAGMTEKGFRKMMGCECLIYGLRSICYGVILSTGSSYLAYCIWQNGVEFSYRLPWLYWLISVAAVFLVVGITMIYTMGKMRKDNVIDVLKQNG
ncbi:MAG: ABC transporter permease [Clostridiales bacterium]|nr:ABC transporter permease [Clostridiales bacterium]